jgi:hypothetical protein
VQIFPQHRDGADHRQQKEGSRASERERHEVQENRCPQSAKERSDREPLSHSPPVCQQTI